MAPSSNEKNGSDAETNSEAERSVLTFFVNGCKIEDPVARPEMTLLTYLRLKLRLCGTKLGCGEGGCGACTVMVSSLDQKEGDKLRHVSVNACLLPVVAVHGMAVTTVEGIGSTKTRLHAVQERMADSHGSQCGFCTPGIVMSMYTLLRNEPKPDMEDIETYFQGNLCRCTGYRPILEGYKTFTESWASNNPILSSSNGRSGCTGAKNGVCCQQQQNNCDTPSEDTKLEERIEKQGSSALFNPSNFQPYDPSQEIIFPPELKLNYSRLMADSLYFYSDKMKWFRPKTLSELLSLKKAYPNAKIVVGNTELGVEMKFKNCKYPVMIQPSLIPEMNVFSESKDEKYFSFGAALTLSEIEVICIKEMEKRPKHETQILAQIVEMLRWFAGKQIRNVAAVGGNIMTGSPISDLNQIFMAGGCQLKLQSLDQGLRIVPMDSNFFTGYRRNIVRSDEILVSISIPILKANQYFVAYKQARRRDDDIAIVNSAFLFQLDHGNIEKAQMAFGGMAPTTVMPLKTMSLLEGSLWSSETIEKACDQLLLDLPLPPGVPGAMARYRQSLTISFLFKAFLSINKVSDLIEVDGREKSAAEIFHKKPIRSHQFFEIVDNEEKNMKPVGQPIKHKSADKQATGEAVFVDDMPHFENELYLGFVLSTKSHAKIVSIDESAARNVPGFVDFLSSHDLTDECNTFSLGVVPDETVFAKNIVETVGQIVGAVVANDQASAQEAAKLVKVSYEDLPAIVTIEEAISANSFHEWSYPPMKRGDPDKAFKECDYVIEGEMGNGAQEQFYLETNTCIAVPGNEDGEVQLYASTQNATEVQECVAHVLGVDMNKIVCHVKRIGGGFGGKETRSIPLAIVCALAAEKTHRPVRVMLDRDEDMVMTGHRHPFLGKYKVGFNKDGTITALDMDLYCNAGYTMDLSFSVMERGLTHSCNAYNIENVHVRGHICRTNLPSNTAFRGFGGPQGCLIAEHYMDCVASKLKINPEEIRRKHLNKENDRTFYNQILRNCTLERCWSECLRQSNYEKEIKHILEFNKANKWKKRGLSIIPVQYGIAFGAPHLNQSGALVQIYRDGSVLLSHGGMEMGQGLHTKMIQVASQVLEVPHQIIHIAETATDKVPNTSPTAASSGSDLNGMAVFNACKTLASRLQRYRTEFPKETWKQWIMRAYQDRVSLSATGFYSVPNLGPEEDTNSYNKYNYFTFGVGCSVVEIDCLTGDHDVLKANLVMDLGESLNPAIDIGQIEGAYMQGYGLFAIEQLVHSPQGNLLTRGPGAYKIPGFGDIPSEFTVSLLRGSGNPRAVFSSKAVGEPPLFLASSVFFAIKDAIRQARKESNADPDFELMAPATAERIRMACEDQFTGKVPKLPKKGSFVPWGIQT